MYIRYRPLFIIYSEIVKGKAPGALPFTISHMATNLFREYKF